MLNEIKVYQYEAVALTSIESNLTFLATSTATPVEFTLKDQFSNIFPEAVTYKVKNGTYNTSTKEITATSEGPVIVTAKDANDNEVSITLYAVAEAAPAMPSYTKGLDIYSEVTSINTVWSNAYMDGTYGAELSLKGNNVKVINNLKNAIVTNSAYGVQDGNGFYIGTEDVLELKDYNTVYMNVYPVQNAVFTITLESKSGEGGNIYKSFNLAGGQWNSIKFTFTPNTQTLKLVKLENQVATSVLVDNILIYYRDPSLFDITVNGATATVTGNVSESDKATIKSNSGNASIIDLSGATIAAGVTDISTNNPNAIFVYADQSTAEGQSGNAVWAADVRFYGAPNGLTFVDDPANVPLMPAKAFSNLTAEKPVTITREIAAGAYVTTYMGTNASVNIAAILESGLDVYELSAATSAELTFTKVMSIVPDKPYVIHNTNLSPATLTWKTTGDQVYFDFATNQDEASVTPINGVKMIGTMQTTTTDGNQWILVGTDDIKKADGAKISAFRAYFTGVGGAGARAFFDGYDITGINGIQDVEKVLNGKFYNLQGQEVKSPTKGVYIVNGKKVIFK